LLQPEQAGASIIGHGDAHNGNVFYRPGGLMYFDPAFAGRHHPVLDLTKPLFHNVFAMWMYYPQEKRAGLNIRIERTGERWHVQHDYALHPVRQMFLESKVDRVLKPIVGELRARGWLREDWRDYLKAALFCCPFLTMNLADETRFPPEIRLLGLSMAVEMGTASSGKGSLIDQILERI
jgi:aminoglycoside phosphotransferase (APT) family kinase protein